MAKQTCYLIAYYYRSQSASQNFLSKIYAHIILPDLNPLAISSIHSPSLLSPQLCVVRKAHSLKPILESSLVLHEKV